MEITRLDYFRTILPDTHLVNIEWYYSMFTILDRDNLDSKYIRVLDKDIEVYYNDSWNKLTDVKDFPIFNLGDIITLKKGDLANLTTDVDTTIGRAVMNKVLLEYNFNNKIPYINKPTSIKDLEKIIAGKLKNEEISVKEYINFADAVNFLRGLTRITNVSATYKNILPPPNLDKIKKDKFKEFTTMYGEDWVKDRAKVVEYQEELKKVDTEWLQDDPSYGKLINNKIKNNARVKMYLTFGPEVGFDKTGEKMTFVQNSLADGYPTDPEQLAALYNSSRSGSYDRGHETQNGGAVAKDILRSTSGYTIEGEDCGSTEGYSLLVNKDIASALKGRYILQGKQPVLIDNPEQYIGKIITIRSPMFCRNKGETFCSKCVGANMAPYKDGVTLLTLNVSNIILTTSLKSMHNTTVTLHPLNLHDVIV